ncbi:MAG: MFS transporter [Bacteroidota bacterium]|nr:MFS transporter [Bacteroidota bacterium]MDP4190093.1 MFS transporter [Bacteroidota bacterium]MDP4193708.1 MFS transporter [Bacteroidota bacterium]
MTNRSIEKQNKKDKTATSEHIQDGKDGLRVNKLKGKVSWNKTFAALKHRNYRLWFWGQMTSLVGSWMQTTAQGYLIFQLTHSPAFLGYVGFASGIPAWLFMLYGGVIADRVPRRTVLMITQSFMMILAMILAVLTFTNTVQPWHIILLAFGLGVANAFDSPARQAFVLELIEGREDLVNAIALNSTMFNSATAIGPAVAGLTYAAFGPAWCFTINGVSFIGVIIALVMMRIKYEPTERKSKNALAELKEGMSYVLKSQKIIRTVIILVVFFALFGISFATLVPAWAVKILHGNAATNGYLQSARGLGALIAALFIATVSHLKIKGKLLTFGMLSYPIFLLLFSLVHYLPVSLILLVAVGMAQILTFNVANALIQTLVSDDFRGRVMGIYSIGFFGFMPIGALIVGSFAEHMGEPAALIINSTILILVTVLVFFAVPKLKSMP